MTDSVRPAARRPRSLAMLAGAAAFAIFIPFIQLVDTLLFRDPSPLPSAKVWAGFVAVMAVVGGFVGAALHATAASGGWKRSFMWAATFSLLVNAQVDEYASLTWGRWIWEYLVVGLITGAIFGSIIQRLRPKPRARTPADESGLS